jgi:hypothetical protein
MCIHLSDDDSRALDLILNGRHQPSGGFAVGVMPASGGRDPLMPARAAAVRAILDVVGAMPTGEPAPDLVARTMRHIERHARPPISPSDTAMAMPPPVV